MTVIYIHGVNVRDVTHGEKLGDSFQRWLGPVLAGPSGKAAYKAVYWGDLGATFEWKLKSRPKTLLLKAGGTTPAPQTAAELRLARWTKYSVTPAAKSGPVLDKPKAAGPPVISPALIPAEDRADFLSDLYVAIKSQGPGYDVLAEQPALAAIADAAQAVATEWELLVKAGDDPQHAAAKLAAAIEKKLSGATLQMGGKAADFLTKAGEVLKRTVSLPFDAVGTMLAELRPPANNFVAHFLGDVIKYLNKREINGSPGEIPQRVLNALAEAHRRKKETGERIVIVTHSMGGQLLYDALQHFAPHVDELKSLEVDHWISCGSQVSFFAELNSLLSQDAARGLADGRLRKPDNVRRWTNYYDRNDVVGFIMEPVFEGVADEEYDTGYGLVFAHTGFLARPSFFAKIAKEIKEP